MMRCWPRLPFLFALLSLPTFAASKGLFDRFTVEDGISHNQINALAQDSLGFFWIGTPDGLTRFDGYAFVQYRHDYSDSLSLPANFVASVYVDRSGNLWAGTFNGICRYDPVANGFVRYPIDAAFRQGSGEYSVVAIGQGSDSVLWIATDKGILRLFPQKHSVVPLMKADGQPYRFGSAACFTQDPWIRRMWIGLQSGGLAVYNEKNAGLFVFKISSPEERLLARSRITSIIPDTSILGERVLWVSSVGDGLFKLNLFGENNDSIHVVRVEQAGSVASRPQILSLFKDDSGVLWAGTIRNGIIELSMRNGEVHRRGIHLHNSGEPLTISNNTITTILEDHSGNLWFGTTAGLNKMVRRRNEFEHVVPPGLQTVHRQEPSSTRGVTSLFEDLRGEVWVGAQAGKVFAFDPSKKGVDRFSPAGVNRALSAGFSIVAMHEMKTQPGVLWIATYGNGLFRWDVGSGNIIHLSSSIANVTTLSSNSINCLTNDDQGRLWVGTDNGLNMIDPVSLKATRLVYTPAAQTPSDSTRLLSNAIWTIVPDRNPTSAGLWIGTVGGSLSRFDLTSYTFRHFTTLTTPALTNRSVTSLYCDSSGSLWIGTYSGGLKRLDPLRQSMSEFTTRDGFPSNMIQGILQDGRGQIWLSTNNGLCRLNAETKQVQTFELHDGLQGNQFYRGARLQDRTGALLFGGPNGFNRFNPDSITLNACPPRVLLTHVQVLGNSRDIVSPFAGSTSVELVYTDNSLSFEFLAIDLTNSRRNKYAYMLEGADNSWIESGSRRNATYANLSPGSYRFHVKASNNDGIWNEPGVVLSIDILPPYWRTWWFLSGALLLCFSVIVMAYRVRVRSQIQRRLEIERIREEESEKVRIKTARDFHDEMGHRLTRINMLSETASRKLDQSPAEIKDLLDAIQDNANHLFNGTRDFIWSLNSQNDSLFDVAARLKDFGDELFYKTGVAFQSRGISEDFHSIRMTMEIRRQLMLIFKEAMTNTAKHARGRNVELGFDIEGQTLCVSLADDGAGFELQHGKSGTGISSMHARAQKAGGTLVIDSTPSGGTRVSVHVPLNLAEFSS